MNTKTLIACGALLAGILPMLAADETPPATAPAKEAAPAAPAPSALDTQLQALVGKINDKLRSGSRTAEALAPELKEFDELIAAHKTEKNDSVARAQLMRAMLYAQVLDDADKASALLQDIAKDFADSEPGTVAKTILKQIDAQKESRAIQASLKAGATFPDFDAKDLAGQPLSLSKYKGKVVLVDFWATWCGPCRAELPNVVAAYSKYHEKGFDIVGISLDQSEDALKNFLPENKVTWAQYFDGKGWENELARKYGITSIPMTFLLDKEGKIVAKDLRGEALAAELDRLLK